MLPFPDTHREITQQLLNGRFILQGEKLFDTIKENGNKEMYYDFFIRSFDYELVITTEYIYLKSNNSKETNTRDFTIFLALLCRELYKDGKDFKREIETESFVIEEIQNSLNDSSKKEIIEYTDIINFIDFLNAWQRRNVIEFVGTGKTKFRFTKAVHLFFDYATTLANEKLKEVQTPTTEQ